MKRIVAVVDDDESVRESLPDLLGEIGFKATAFASAQEFLAYDRIAEAQCLILDISMPGMSGPELQCELIRRGHLIPTIFMTARQKTAFLLTSSSREPLSVCSSRSAARSYGQRSMPRSIRPEMGTVCLHRALWGSINGYRN